MAQKKKGLSTTQVAAGAGIGAAILAAAAGAYFLYGKDAPKRRKAVRSWMLKAKGEVLEQIEGLPEIDKATYFGLIDAAAARYMNLKDVSSAEVAELVKELQGYWTGLRKQFAPAKPARKKAAAKKRTGKTVARRAKAPARKAAARKKRSS